MGDWMISKSATGGLRCPLGLRELQRFDVIGSRAELKSRSVVDGKNLTVTLRTGHGSIWSNSLFQMRWEGKPDS